MYLHAFLLAFMLICAKSSTLDNVEDFSSIQFTDLLRFAENSGQLDDNCTKHIKHYLDALLHFETWAVEMFDSTSKLQSGILHGNFFNLGDYDQCLSVFESTKTNISGKYCIANMKMPVEMSDKLNSSRLFKTNLYEGFTKSTPKTNMLSVNQAICIPKSCSGSELAETISNVVENMSLHIDDRQCHVAQKYEMSAGNIVVLTFLGIYLTWILICTVCDFLDHIGDARFHFGFSAPFSFYTHYRKLFTINDTSAAGSMPCLNGIRVLSMMWIIFSHRYFLTVSMPAINLLDGVNWFLSPDGSIVIGSTITVDTFLILSGFLLSLLFFKNLDKTRGRINLPYFYIHRYIRLTGVLMFIILFHVTLLKDFGSGPLWDLYYNSTTSQCDTYWWSALLYVQNYVNPNAVCIGHSWYLSVDMQLYCLSPLLLYPMWKYKKIGRCLYFFLLCVFELVLILVVCTNKIKVGGIAASGQEKLDWTRLYYEPTHTRAVPWLFGVGLGYIIYNYRGTYLSLNMLVNFSVWIGAFTTAAGVIFGIHPFIQLNYKYNEFNDTLYLSLSRIGWSLVVCWTIYACLAGYGGIINRFLSMGMWQPLSRLSYTMYLVHLSFQTYHGGSMRQPAYFSNFDMFYNFLGDFLATVIISLGVSMMFESPIMALEKILVDRARRFTASNNENNNGVEEAAMA